MLKEKIKSIVSEIPKSDRELSLRLYGKMIFCVIPKDISPRDRMFNEFTNQTDFISDVMGGVHREIKSCIIAFPENYLSQKERLSFLKIMLENKSLQEIVFITTDPIIGTSFISQLMMIMYKERSGKAFFENVGEKTLQMGIYTFYSKILKNPLSADVGRNMVQKLIDIVQDEVSISKEIYNQTKYDISLIGEPLIEKRLLEMLEQTHVH